MSNFYVIIVALADDDNRIALKPLPEFEDCQGDYINACYVDVRNTASLTVIILLPTSHHTTHKQLTIPSIHLTLLP